MWDNIQLTDNTNQINSSVFPLCYLVCIHIPDHVRSGVRTWSVLRAIKFPMVLLKKEASRGLRGGSCSRKW